MIRIVRNFAVFLFLMACITGGCRAQEANALTEEGFREKIDQWMRPYRHERSEELYQWFKSIQRRPDSVRKHPVYASLWKFYQKHRQSYRQLRLQSLQRYPSRPRSFPGYQEIDVQRLWKGDVSLDSMLALFQDINNIRTINVESTSGMQGMLSAMILGYISKEQDRTLTDLSRLLGFGHLVFADKANGDTWNVAYVNRCYILNYQWNIDNNRITGLSVLVHDGTRQQPGWLQDVSVKATTPALRLFGKAVSFSWKLYDDMQEGEKEEKLYAFMNDHRNEYVEVRKAALERKPGWTSGWPKGYQPAETLTADLLYSLSKADNAQGQLLAADLAFLEFDCFNLMGRFKMLALKESGSREDLAISWLTGDEVHARKQNDLVWEIQGFHRQYAITYTWNIATNGISNLQCWKKS